MELGYEPKVILSGRSINDYMGAYVAKNTVQLIIKQEKKKLSEAKVLIMGTTFKENVSDIRNSKVADVVEEFKSYSVSVDVYDPYADSEELKKRIWFWTH